MRMHSKLLLAGLTAALTLAVAVAAAPANNLRLSSQSFRISWSALRFIGGTSTVTCHVTLEGSFHAATTAKVLGRLLGYITRGALDTCTGGSATLLSATLPWHVRYAGFTGTLPVMTSVIFDVIGLSVSERPEGATACLLRSEANHPSGYVALVVERAFEEFAAGPSDEIPLTSELGLCRFAGEGHFSGNGNPTVLATTTKITVTLI